MVLLVVPALVGCDGGTRAPAFVVRDSAGVTIAESTRYEWDTADGWVVGREPTVEIGALAGDPRYLFDRIEGVVLLGDRVVVADAGAKVVRVYTSDGRFTAGLGGEGEGPGEFVDLGGLHRAGETRVASFDRRSRRVTTLDLARGVPETALLSQDAVRPDAFQGVLADGSFLFNRIANTDFRERGPVSRDSMTLLRYAAGGSWISELGSVLGMRRYTEESGASNIDPYSPWGFIAVRGDLVYLADSARPEVRVYDVDEGLRRIVRWPARRVGRPEAIDRLEDTLSALPSDRVFERDPSQSAGFGPLPAFSSVLVDTRGSVWVRDYTVPDDSFWLAGPGRIAGGTWQVFDPDGRWLGPVAMPDELVPLEISDDAVAGIRRDGLGVEYVRVHALDRRGAAP